MLFTLRNRFLLIFTCLLTIPFVILSIIIPSFFTTEIREQTQELTIEMMDQFSLYVDSITTQAEDLGKQVLVDQSTQEWVRLNRHGAEKEEIDSVMNQLRQNLSSIMINNSNAMSISVMLDDGTGSWGNHVSLDETEWYQDFTQNHQDYVQSHLDPFQQSHEMQVKKVNSYILPLIDTNTMITAGVIKVNVPSVLLETALNKIKKGQNEHTYLLNQQGENVLSGKIRTPSPILQQSLKQINASDDQEGLIEASYQKERYLVFFQKLPVGDWIVVSEVAESELFARANHLQQNLLLTSAVLFILTIVASYFMSNTITSPLGRLAKAMRLIERGDFSGAKVLLPESKSQNNEVDYLIDVTNHTIDRLQNLIETEYEANLRRKDAEYKALLLQINPHFLNNTLEIIGSLALQEKNKEVMNVSVYLGKMLRYSLNTNSSMVSLGEELNYIKSYTNILKLRYEDMLSVQMDVDSDTEMLPVIKFILQPLVENAVKYSFSEKTFAEIFIRTKKVGNQISISVKDQGTGMSEEMISNLQQNDETMMVLESKGNSIGLRNVLGRLKLTYGNDFSYQIESKKNEGTKITLLIDVKGGRDRLKVLIVDDEIQIRKGLRLKVDWEDEGIQLVEEAANGKEALEILQTKDIDVVITDMRMPIMDGVELAKRCHQEFPHVKVIVLSGYSDFDYVRDSLQQGVKDYLLKPVAPDELVEALRKIRKEVEEEKRKQVEFAQMSRLVHSHLQELQEQFILHLAKEEVLQLPIVVERLQQLQLEELANENGKVQFITVEIRESNDPHRLEELRIPFQLLCKEIAQQQKGAYLFTDPSYPNMVQFLKLLDSQFPSTDQFVLHIQQNVNKLLKIETVIGIGAIVNGLSEYRSGYISSLLAWSQSQLGSKSQIMDQTAASEALFDFSPDFEKRITNSIENLDFVAFKDNLQMVLEGSEGRSVMSFSFGANQVLFMLGSLAKKYDVETKDIQNTIWNCQQNIWKLYSQHKVKEDLIELASLIIEKVRLARFSNKKLIDSIRHYLDQHYASEISLTTLSTLFHINSAHLSETFKHHVGQNFSDYLVTLRMNKAKQLLKDKQLKIIDVSNLVGFSNSGYFSTVFKKHFGQTPVEFRNSIGNG